MAWLSHTTTPPSLMTGTRPCGFMLRNAALSNPPKSPPAGTCSCARPNSPTNHITFWTLNEFRRPQTVSAIATLHLSRRECAFILVGPPSMYTRYFRGRGNAAMRITMAETRQNRDSWHAVAKHGPSDDPRKSDVSEPRHKMQR